MNQENFKNYSSLNILLISLGMNWTSKERATLRDCKIVQESEQTPILYCCKGSFIDSEASALGIRTIYHQVRSPFNLFKWYKFSKLIKGMNISLVHCYDIDFLLKICIFMMGTSPQVPLVYSLFGELKRSYRSFWRGPFIKRVDMVVVPFFEMEENVWNKVGINPKKVHVCGAGIEPVNLIERRRIPNSVAISIKAHVKKFSEISTLINTAFMFKTRGFNDFKVFLHYEGSWNDSELHKELKNHVLAYKLEENFIFIDGMSIPEVASQVELWLQLESTGWLEDGMLQALISGTPVLIPRNGVNIELLDGFPSLGESYKVDDVREFKQKLQHIFNSLGQYSQAVEQHRKQIAIQHGIEKYKNGLLTGYIDALSHRERIFK
ncbi:MAG: hypothetical protein KAG61_01815 [Bacteriovoracaceae bacterium]|nr:hypothetical protein [Bacteriovoracaceae bacterium]